ncbi:hypothetical protein Pfo_028176 [Paulownia fortunei]|nr:hypothetical protein Pfo_028176 [Paulownia fortunei]
MDILEAQPVIQHFSHQHPLKLMSYQTSNTDRIACSACTKEATGWTYICESCNYCLHKACTKLPQKLIHRADKKHALTLLSSPAYEGGEFVCNACGALGTGFCYHCAECQLDLHAICSFMPSSILSNHEHTLNLCFEPPYENSVFKCDICGGSGSNHWLYRCESCEFDVHMKCAKATQQPSFQILKMGKIDAEASINHFSHPHPLKLLSFQSSTANRITCSACTKEASGFVYICESCSYCLHKPCSNMPRSLNHQADHKHTLTLLPTPAYTGGSFQCNACGVLGTGFCYHCAECQLDLHTVCAFMRSTVKGSAHDHALKLCFEPPYEDKAFICDVCGGSGSNHWLYRCDSCGFDAHLKCAKAPNVQPRTASQISKTNNHKWIKNLNPTQEL